MGDKSKLENNIVDIAKALGISAATVSRALNNHPRISELTKERVRKKAEEMNYRPNKMASSLRSRKSNVIGLIVPRVSMYFHSVFVTALQNRFQHAGYNIIICQSNDSVSVEKALTNTLYSSQVDALIVSLSLSTDSYSHFDGFIERGIPIFFYDRVPASAYPAYVFKGDDFNGGYLAGNHLVEVGCKKIACISGPLTLNLYIDRMKGFEAALQEHGLDLRKEWVYHQELNASNAKTTLKEIFSTKDVPDAIFAGNDTTAIEVIKFARERSINIPGSLKVIGYSNDPRTAIITPPITTVEQFPKQMAEEMATKIINLLDKSESAPMTHKPTVIPVALIKRASTSNI
jgi:LacI family transcriptional regulator